MREKTYCVYIHITPSNKAYIGITCQEPKRRWRGGLGYQTNEHFYRAIQKYGWDNIEHIIFADGLTKEKACKIEKTLIALYDTTNYKYGYNKSTGGEGGGSGSGKSIYCIERDKFYLTIADAAKDNNLNSATIKTDNKPHKGLHFVEFTAEEVEDYRMFQELSTYQSLQDADFELTDDICELLFG